MGFGSGNPIGLEVHLKTNRACKGVVVTFVADGVRIETKSKEVLNGVSDAFKVASQDRRFTHGAERSVEVTIKTVDGGSSGPYRLSVPKPESGF